MAILIFGFPVFFTLFSNSFGAKILYGLIATLNIYIPRLGHQAFWKKILHRLMVTVLIFTFFGHASKSLAQSASSNPSSGKNKPFQGVFAFSKNSSNSSAKPIGVNQEWQTWVQKLKDRYQERFAPPTVTHHFYLKKTGDDAWVDETHSYPRWVSDRCKDCRYQVKRNQGKKTSLIDHKTKKSMALDFERENPVPGKENLFVSIANKPDGSQRLFLHDLSQKLLDKKRKRYFFGYKKEFVWPGQFYWLKKPKEVTIQRSDGSTKKMSMVAQIRYQKDKIKGSLSVYEYHDDSKKQKATMLLFRDHSNGKKTYGAGRFLVLPFPKPMGEMKDGTKLSVDFNFAYNPPCAVSTGFHCPLPQDLVPTEVLVGESYKKS